MVTYQAGNCWMTMAEAVEAGMRTAFSRRYDEYVHNEVYHFMNVVITIMRDGVFQSQYYESYFVPMSRAPPEFCLQEWPCFNLMLPTWLEGLYATSPVMRQYVPDEATMKRAMGKRHMFIRGGTVFAKPFKFLSSRVIPLTFWTETTSPATMETTETTAPETTAVTKKN